MTVTRTVLAFISALLPPPYLQSILRYSALGVFEGQPYRCTFPSTMQLCRNSVQRGSTYFPRSFICPIRLRLHTFTLNVCSFRLALPYRYVRVNCHFMGTCTAANRTALLGRCLCTPPYSASEVDLQTLCGRTVYAPSACFILFKCQVC